MILRILSIVLVMSGIIKKHDSCIWRTKGENQPFEGLAPLIQVGPFAPTPTPAQTFFNQTDRETGAPHHHDVIAMIAATSTMLKYRSWGLKQNRLQDCSTMIYSRVVHKHRVLYLPDECANAGFELRDASATTLDTTLHIYMLWQNKGVLVTFIDVSRIPSRGHFRPSSLQQSCATGRLN